MKEHKPLQNDVLEVTPAFKKEVSRSILAIVYFITVYCLLFLLSLGIAAASAAGGIALIVNFPKFITLLVGLGLIGVGIMVVIFLIKFLFATTKADESDSIEITEDDQPELVKFIYDIAEQTNTFKPKKIFLSGDVNACVFYDSSFWSMFFPVKKNLKIGLGLVNALNVSEFKAVLAHEFGHFSQRSMKLGSYVYQVNRIIHDMLFNNSGYAKTIDSWGNVHGVFSLFAALTVQIVKGIQSVLVQMYKIINKSYMGLSRQMEFHADLVASTVSGRNNIISALKRVEFAGVCYSTTINLYNQRWQENKVLQDVYEDHKIVMRQVAHLNNVPFVDGLPMPTKNFDNTTSQVNYKDQWASHPTLQEREEYLSGFDLDADVDTTAAWTLFANTDVLKKQLTNFLYRDLPIDDKQVLNHEAFEESYVKQIEENSLPEVFNGYYDNRQVDLFDTEVNGIVENKSLSSLLTEESIIIPKKIQMMWQDIATLEAISRKEIDVKSFDFDGQKYQRSQAIAIKEQLEEELKQLQESVAALDRELYLYFYHRAPFQQAEELRLLYNNYFQRRRDADVFIEKANAVLDFVNTACSGNLTQVDEVNNLVATLKSNREQEFKTQLIFWKEAGAFNSDIAFKEKLEKFIAADYQYFDGEKYFDNELANLNELGMTGWSFIQTYLFSEYKKILELQASLVSDREKVMA